MSAFDQFLVVAAAFFTFIIHFVLWMIMLVGVIAAGVGFLFVLFSGWVFGSVVEFGQKKYRWFKRVA